MGYAVGPEGASPSAAGGPRRRRWGPLATAQSSNTALHTLQPKNDTHGIGYDPYQDAPAMRRLREQQRDAKTAHLNPPSVVPLLLPSQSRTHTGSNVS
jgi:hypothetical protein